MKELMPKPKPVNEDIFVVLDLETTGLNPVTEPILEIGIVLWDRTKDSLIDACSWLTKPVKRSVNDRTRYVEIPIQEVYDAADPFVQKMHDGNDLWADLEEATTTIFDAGKQIPEWMKMNGLDIKNETFTMMGNGPDRFDRPFLRHNGIALNNLDSLFHYRSLDVSNIYHAAKFCGIDLTRPENTTSNHRAVDDCIATLEDWRYISNTLKTVFGQELLR